MVSFQCDGCQDVVKKPKLDAHGSRCHASFTCIDCSKTFAGPAQWKSHTSCMSEEQKYHKSVYQEPRGRGRGRGQRGGRGGARGSGRPSYAGSGENSIPLGPQVNAWTAPPPDPVNNAPFNPNNWTAADAQPNAPSKDTPIEAEPEPEPESGKKPKKSKKRKAEEEPTADATEPASPDEPAKKKKKKLEETASTPDSSDPTLERKDKKKKKSRKSETTDADSNTVDAMVEEPTGKDKKEKKEKKSKGSSKDESPANVTPMPADSVPAPTSFNGTATNGDAVAKTNGTDESAPKKKKSRKSKDAADEPTVVTEEPSTNGLNGQETKKDKKNKKNKDVDTRPSTKPAEPAAVVANSQTGAPNDTELIPISTIEAANGTTKKEKKSKKEKKDKDAIPTPDESIVPDPAPDASPALESEHPSTESKKSKKRKSHGINGSEAEANGTMADGVKEKSKKKSKRRDKESTEAAA